MRFSQNIRFRLVSNTIVQIAGTFLTSLVGLLIVIKIARNLKAENFGLYTFVLFFIGLFKYLMFAAADPIFVQRMSVENKEQARLVMGNMLIIKLVLGLVAALVTALMINLLGYPQINRVLVYIGCLVFLSSVFASSVTVLNANLKMVYDAFAGIISALFYLIWVVVAFQLGRGLAAVVWGWVICDMLRWIIVFWASRSILRPKFAIDIMLWKDILKKSSPLWLSALFIAVMFHADILILSKIKSNHDVGIYGAASRIIRFLIIFPQAIGVSAFPLLSKLYVSDKERFRKLYYRISDYIIIIALPLTAGIFIFSNHIVLALFKSEFWETAAALRILILSIPFLFLGMHCSYALVAANQRIKSMLCSFLGAAASLGLNLVFITRYGLQGAALAWVISQAVIFMALIYYLYKTERLSLSPGLLPSVVFINIIFVIAAILLRPAALYYSIPLLIFIYFLLACLCNCINLRDFLLMLEIDSGENE
jgi:O-antigen/teichoic acid export membrane protein